MLPKQISDAIGERLGERLVGSLPALGGDINDAYIVELGAGRKLFVKTHRAAPPGLYLAEAAGLDWLREANCVSVPEVLCVSDDAPRFIAMAFVARAPRARDFDEVIGRSLASMHRAAPERFGFDSDNFIGTLRQPNPAHRDWATFYRDARLEPQLRLARDSGRLPASEAARFDRLLRSLPSLVGPPESPARLHGDLWSGNVLAGADGRPVLIDPAVYAGHREVDLAMMRLFGGFSPRTFAAYSECWPPAPDEARRVPLYQLYPLMVHVNLFGGAYYEQLMRTMNDLGF